MPIVDGVYVPLTFEEALEQVINNAPATIQFSPGNPPELILANMFAKAAQLADERNGETLAALFSPVGALIDLQNPNNPRRQAIPTVGYLVVSNPTAGIITIAPNTVFKASTGQEYSVGVTSIDVPAMGTAEAVVTAVEAGIGGNIPANRSFTAADYPDLTATNPLPWLDGADAETDARYLERTIAEKSEYGSQANSVAAEVELKKYYSAARIRVNKSQIAQTAPVPVPGNGYNMVIRTPNGANASALESQKAFEILAKRFEFVNSQNVGDARHAVIGGTIYKSGIPQSYFYTAAQPVDTTVTATLRVRFANGTARSEKITQANDFASYFIRRLMAFLSGVAGTSTVTYTDIEGSVNTPIDFPANLGETDPIAPAFGIEQVRDLISDLSTRKNTPQLFYDGVDTLEVVLDPLVAYEPVITMSLDPYDTQFIDFLRDQLFSDNTSWYDRYAFIDPAQVSVTVVEVT